jgi:hypothetical protein
MKKPTEPDIIMFTKLDINTAPNSESTNSIPSFGMVDSATAKKLKSKNGNTNISRSFRHVLIVRNNLITSLDRKE